VSSRSRRDDNLTPVRGVFLRDCYGASVQARRESSCICVLCAEGHSASERVFDS